MSQFVESCKTRPIASYGRQQPNNKISAFCKVYMDQGHCKTTVKGMNE